MPSQLSNATERPHAVFAAPRCARFGASHGGDQCQAQPRDERRGRLKPRVRQSSSERAPRHVVPRDQREADAVDVRQPSAPTLWTIRRRGSRPTPGESLILEGKAKGPRSGATINEPQHASALPRLSTTYDPRRTSNKGVRCQDGWSSRLNLLWVRTISGEIGKYQDRTARSGGHKFRKCSDNLLDLDGGTV